MDIADLDHCSTRFDSAFVVLAVSTTATVPGVRPFHHPAFLDRRESTSALRTFLHLDPPLGTMLVPPSLQAVVVVLVVTENHFQPGEILGCDLAQDLGRRSTIVRSGRCDQYRYEQAEGIDQQMSLAALDFLASVVTPLLPAHPSVVFTDWLSMHIALGVGSRSSWIRT